MQTFQFNFKQSTGSSTGFEKGPLTESEIQYLLQVRNVCRTHIENIQDRSERYIDYLNVIEDEFNVMVDSIGGGLAGYLDKLKTGMAARHVKPVTINQNRAKDMKPVYHISMGTETLKCSFIDCDGSFITETFKIRETVDVRQVTAFVLFDFISQCFEILLKRYPNENMNEDAEVVFSTSMPLTGNCIDYLKSDWKEDTEAFDPLLNTDIKELFNYQCKRKSIRAQCRLVTTDAIVSLAYGDYANFHPKALMAIHLGAGLDMAYGEVQLGAKDYLLPLSLDSLCTTMFRSVVDQLHDFNHGRSRGKRTLERLVGGHGLADSVRLNIVKIFQGESPKALFKEGTFEAEDVYNIVNDRTDAHIVARRVLLGVVKENAISDYLVDTLYDTCKAVVNRAVAVIAAVIIGVAKGSGRCQEGFGTTQVILQGNVFKSNPGVMQQVQQVIHEKVSKAIRVKYYREAEHTGCGILQK